MSGLSPKVTGGVCLFRYDTPTVFACGESTSLREGGKFKAGEMRMYLSIGNDMAVRDRSVIGIFDLDNTSTSKRTREFLEKNEKEGQVVPCDDLPKSFVLTTEYGMDRVYLTSLSASTLERRLR